MNTATSFDGETVSLGGKQYTLPPLSLRQVEKFQARIDAYLKGEATHDTVALMIDVVHSALSRNYATLTRDDVGDMLDLRNIQPVFMALLRQSGWAPSAQNPEQAEPEPEGNPQGQTSLGTGSPSTPL